MFLYPFPWIVLFLSYTRHHSSPWIRSISSGMRCVHSRSLRRYSLTESIFFFFRLSICCCCMFRVFVVDIWRSVVCLFYSDRSETQTYTHTDTNTVSTYGHVTNWKRFFNQFLAIFVCYSILFFSLFACALTVNRNCGIFVLTIAAMQSKFCSACIQKFSEIAYVSRRFVSCSV